MDGGHAERTRRTSQRDRDRYVSDGGDRYASVGAGPTGLFLDSSALFAYFYPEDTHHDDARTFFERLCNGVVPYRPVFVNDYVLDEVVTLLGRYSTHDVASAALSSVYEGGAFKFERLPDAAFEAAVEAFRAHDDHDLSFTDHAILAHCEALDVNHLYSYDDDFDAFDVVRLPHYEE